MRFQTWVLLSCLLQVFVHWDHQKQKYHHQQQQQQAKREARLVKQQNVRLSNRNHVVLVAGCCDCASLSCSVG